MKHYLSKMVQLFLDRAEDSMAMLCDPHEVVAAHKDASEYIYQALTSLLSDMGAKPEIINEADNRLSASKSYDGFEFTHDDGSRSRLITARTSEEWMDFHEAQDLGFTEKMVDSLVDKLWDVVRKHVHGDTVWFLTPPKLWFQFRAGKVELRAWCTLVS